VLTVVVFLFVCICLHHSQALSAENISLQEQVNDLEEQVQYQVELCAHAKEEAVIAREQAALTPTAAGAAAGAAAGNMSDSETVSRLEAHISELAAQLAERDASLRELNAKTNELYDSYEQEVAEIKLQNARRLSTFMILQRHRAAFGTRRSLLGVDPVAMSASPGGSPRASGWRSSGAVTMTVGTCWLKWKLMVVEVQREEVSVKVTALEEFINHSLAQMQAEAKAEQSQGLSPSHGSPDRGTPTWRTFVCSQCSRSMTPNQVCDAAISVPTSPTRQMLSSTPMSTSTTSASPFKARAETVSVGVNTDLFTTVPQTQNNRDRTGSSTSTDGNGDLDLLQFLPLSPEVDRSTLPLEAASGRGLRHRDVGASGQKQDPFGHKYTGKGLSAQMEAASGVDVVGDKGKGGAERPVRPAQRLPVDEVTAEDYLFMIVIKVILWCLLLLVTFYVLDTTSQSTDSSENYYNRLVETCVNRDVETVLPLSITTDQFSPILRSLYDSTVVLCHVVIRYFQTPAAGAEMAVAEVDVGAVVSSVIVEVDKLLALCWELTTILFVSVSCFIYHYVQENLRITS
jgi:hypothetical protein